MLLHGNRSGQAKEGRNGEDCTQIEKSKARTQRAGFN